MTIEIKDLLVKCLNKLQYLENKITKYIRDSDSRVLLYFEQYTTTNYLPVDEFRSLISISAKTGYINNIIVLNSVVAHDSCPNSLSTDFCRYLRNSLDFRKVTADYPNVTTITEFEKILLPEFLELYTEYRKIFSFKVNTLVI